MLKAQGSCDRLEQAMLLAFNVDCGEVIPGHRLLAKGLRQTGYSDDWMHGDYSHHYAGKPVHCMVSLEYALVPGLSALQLDGSRRDVGAIVTLDPPADPDHWATRLAPGGWRDVILGSPETAGAFGPFVLPEGTKRVEIELTGLTIIRDGDPNAPEFPEPEVILGTLEVQLSSGEAGWTPGRGREVSARDFTSNLHKSNLLKGMPTPRLMDLLLPSRAARWYLALEDQQHENIAERSGRPSKSQELGATLGAAPGQVWFAKREAAHLARLYRARGYEASIVVNKRSVEVRAHRPRSRRPEPPWSDGDPPHPPFDFGGGDDDGAGDREPRHPLPGNGGASAAVDSDTE